jgi:ornithine cyclodeaminase
VFYSKERILPLIDHGRIIGLMEEAFVMYSKKEAIVPSFGSLTFDDPKGETHIKYGYVQKLDSFVVKVASSFPSNNYLGVSSSQGVLLLFCRKTGQLKSILHDEGYLTDVRTAAAGAVVAKYLAPKRIKAVGIVGTGTQAYFQLNLLKEVVFFDHVIVWGRSQDSLERYVQHIKDPSLTVETTKDLCMLQESCNLIVTTTPSSIPLISNIQKGTHITAVGADNFGKVEIDPEIFRIADLVVCDSKKQCFAVGDCARALATGNLEPEKVRELGEIIQNPSWGRQSEEEITIADLTGLAVQDIMIAAELTNQLQKRNNEQVIHTFN